MADLVQQQHVDSILSGERTDRRRQRGLPTTLRDKAKAKGVVKDSRGKRMTI